MHRRPHDRLCSGPGCLAATTRGSLAFLALHAFASHAADEGIDCVAASLDGVGTLMIDERVVKLTAAPATIPKCSLASFNAPVVRVTFIRDFPLTEMYESREGDRGRPVTEKAPMTYPMSKFLRSAAPSQIPQVPAGQHMFSSGVFSVDPSSGFAMFVDPTKTYPKVGYQSGKLALRAVDPDQKSVTIAGKWCGLVAGKIDCKRTSDDPSVGMIRSDVTPDQLKVGEKYSLSAQGKPKLQLTFLRRDSISISSSSSAVA